MNKKIFLNKKNYGCAEKGITKSLKYQISNRKFKQVSFIFINSLKIMCLNY